MFKWIDIVGPYFKEGLCVSVITGYKSIVIVRGISGGVTAKSVHCRPDFSRDETI